MAVTCYKGRLTCERKTEADPTKCLGAIARFAFGLEEDAVSALQLETAAPARSRCGATLVIKVDISSIELIRNKHFWEKFEVGGVD